MGAWSEDTFGNDTACDWAYSFLKEPGLKIVREAIDEVLSCEGYLNRDQACDCLAACEVIARLQEKWGIRNVYSEQLDEWVEANPTTVPADLKSAADSAIERILGPDSELPELWDEGSRNDQWHASIDDLRARLKG